MMPGTFQLDRDSRVANTWLQRFNRYGWNNSSFQRMDGMLSRPGYYILLASDCVTDHLMFPHVEGDQ